MQMSAEAKAVLFEACSAAIMKATEKKPGRFAAKFEELITELRELTGADATTIGQYVHIVANQYHPLLIVAMLKVPQDREFRALVDFCERTFAMPREEAVVKFTSFGESVRRALGK